MTSRQPARRSSDLRFAASPSRKNCTCIDGLTRRNWVKLAFPGDAHDHWKGSLFESLQQSSVLRDFAVDPMASDWSDWKPEDVLLFTRLLRIDKSQLISTQRL